MKTEPPVQPDDKFWCGVCDRVLPGTEFSHVANLMGVLCCKECNKKLPPRPIRLVRTAG